MEGKVLKNVGSWEPLFLVSLPVRLSFSEAVLVPEQVIFYPELPELSVIGFDDLLYGGYLYAAPHGSLVEIIPGGVRPCCDAIDGPDGKATGSPSPLL